MTTRVRSFRIISARWRGLVVHSFAQRYVNLMNFSLYSQRHCYSRFWFLSNCKKMAIASHTMSYPFWSPWTQCQTILLLSLHSQYFNSSRWKCEKWQSPKIAKIGLPYCKMVFYTSNEKFLSKNQIGIGYLSLKFAQSWKWLILCQLLQSQIEP